jgi:acetyltransferase
MPRHSLDKLISPKGVAVFGASERRDALGAVVFRNLIQGEYAGRLLAINPKHDTVQGRACYPDIASADGDVDLAVIATPAATVPDIIRQCGERGVRSAIVMSAGFGEGGAGGKGGEDDGQGKLFAKQMLEHARSANLRILGPNCLGLLRPAAKLNASFSNNNALPGRLALVSQSGALCTAILDWAEGKRVGFSAVVSLGNAADVNFGDLLDYFALDAETDSILLYVEGIRNARGFMSALRVAARIKPVIVLKAGRHQQGGRAALSHTGALVGADDVFDAALQRAGAVRVTTIEQLFAAATVLAQSPRVKGNCLAVISNGGGPGVMATDRAAELDVTLPELSAATLAQLDEALPAHWSRGNPVDLLGDATPERYATALKACLADEQVHGVLAMLTPQAMTRATEAAQALIDAYQHRKPFSSKPLLTCWMGEEQVAAARELFAQHMIPLLPSPEAAVEAFSYLTAYHHNQQLLLQVPGPLAARKPPDVEGARMIIQAALSEGRQWLDTLESRAVLVAFGIPVARAIAADSEQAALVAAESLGFPVAMKIHSPDITHKSDVGGIRLNLGNAQSVRQTFNELMQSFKATHPDIVIKGVTIEPMLESPNGRELLLGVVEDPVFGPTITFGAGGIAAEVLRDRAVTLPPLNRFLVQRLIAQTRIAGLLGPFRHLPAIDTTTMENILLALSDLVCELPQISELDINPVIADERGAVVVDARIAVRYRAPSLERYSHVAIHPYPGHLTSHMLLPGGLEISIRPIRPEDARIEQTFVRNLSPQSKYFRFMQSLQELTPTMLVRFTQIDYDREMALIAVRKQEGEEQELGVARYVTNPDGDSCEFAIVVADEWRKRGIGSQLMMELMKIAKAKGLDEMNGEVLSDNHDMLALVRRLGFTVLQSEEDSTIYTVRKKL